jgi:hypothetical protein
MVGNSRRRPDRNRRTPEARPRRRAAPNVILTSSLSKSCLTPGACDRAVPPSATCRRGSLRTCQTLSGSIVIPRRFESRLKPLRFENRRLRETLGWSSAALPPQPDPERRLLGRLEQPLQSKEPLLEKRAVPGEFGGRGVDGDVPGPSLHYPTQTY